MGVEVAPAGSGYLVGLSPAGWFDRANQTTLLQPSDGSIQRSWTQANVCELLNIRHHGVSVPFAIGQTCKHEKSWVRHRYYVLRSIV